MPKVILICLRLALGACCHSQKTWVGIGKKWGLVVKRNLALSAVTQHCTYLHCTAGISLYVVPSATCAAAASHGTTIPMRVLLKEAGSS